MWPNYDPCANYKYLISDYDCKQYINDGQFSQLHILDACLLPNNIIIILQILYVAYPIMDTEQILFYITNH